MEELSRKEVLKRIEVCEKERKFDEHVDPIDYNNYIPIDDNYKYQKKGFKENLKNLLLSIFIVKPFTKKVNKDFKTEVVGFDNLKGIKSAIITCNHVNKFDCLVVKKAVGKKKLFVTAGYFNNQKGRFGDYMRAGGMIPIPDSHKYMRDFDEIINKKLKKNYVLFYPEQSMWWNYKKIRPFKNGAFHYAVKNKVPVIPMFITFKDLNENDSEGLKLQKFYIHILKPIHMKDNLNFHENIDYLKETAYEGCVKIYEEFYNKKMEYIR